MAECVVCLCNVLLFLVLCVYQVDLSIADDLSHLKPAADFSKHTLVKPKIYHGREKRQISTSKEKGGTHAHDITVGIDVDGTEHILDLRLNKDLLPKGYFRKYQSNGKHVVDRPDTQEVELCQYQGTLRGVPESWAALSTCRKGLSGIIFDGKELHYIERASDEHDKGFDDLHFMYKHSDLVETNKTCGYEGHNEKMQHSGEHEFNRILRYKRASGPEIRGPYNANKRSRYVELVLVVDNREYKDMGESLYKVYQHCKEIANIINGLYSSLNIFIALVGIVVWTEHDEIDLSPSGDKTLTNFLHYRREKLIKEHPNDNAQLLTKFVFNRGVVGKALKGPICTFEYSGGVSMDHSTVVSLVATTVAHEMGHNFGMEHDTNECHCPEERCIMAPSSSSLWPTHWSSCSLEYLALAFEHGMDYCLRNKPQSLFDSPVCGNGFVEAGEQCDCGIPHTCDNTCCNATTCMLYSNASCATGECCDLKTCRPKTAGSLCRAADYECDLPEFCTGQSEYCPADIYKMDTEICDDGKAFCYQGSCRTRSDQCKLLWGNTGKSSDDQCYKMNTKGSRHGNCGYHRVNQTFIKCEDENVLCGMLHCRHLNERLEFGMESVAILSQSFINLKGSIIPCRTAIVDLGINQVDPGLAPDGAMCGEDMMCVNQKCMAVASLRANINKCPQDCNGNGVCNSLGHCHCREGFAPPFCNYPGPGGSEDSGPATDPNARKEFVMAMYIVFLGIIPVAAIVAFLLYYTRYNVNFKWQKTSAASKSPGKPRGGVTFAAEPAVRNDDNSSLLQDHHAANAGFQNEFFGQFRGFKLAPLSKNEPDPTKPQRSAPPVPAVPSIPSIIGKNLTSNSNHPPPPHISRTPNANAQCRANCEKVSSVHNPVVRTNCDKHQPSVANALLNANSTSVAPALPPPNPGSNPRPLISSPILETSTCTAKELMSPLRSAPKAPATPGNTAEIRVRPLSSPNAIINSAIIISADDLPAPVVKKPKESNSALNRIASFLKSKDLDKSKPVSNNTNSLPRNNVKANKILNKNALRTIEISSPIPQNEIEIGVTTLPVVEDEKNRAVVMRAQSLRDSVVTPRPAIPNFGSMRQPNFKRPTSIPAANRPTSPPPPRPPVLEMEPPAGGKILKIPGLPGYQQPTVKSVVPSDQKSEYQYDDCMNEAPPLAKISEETSPSSGDNIYAVIEECPNPTSAKPLENVKSNSGSSESVGLLGEIVNEIQNRNFDSIYSTSTLARKKKESLDKKQKNKSNDKEKSLDTSADDVASDTYVNTSAIYKSPESVYSNMGNLKSSASSTASGYIHPSAVNAPIVKPIASVVSKNSVSTDTKTTNAPVKNVLSTFKSEPKIETNTYKPFAASLQRSAGPLAAAANLKTSNTTNTNNNKSTTSDAKVTSPTSTGTIKTTKPLSRQTTPPNINRQKTPPNITRQTTPPNISRQTTPPNLRSRKPSPTRTVPASPKNLPKTTSQKSTNSNSPDLVISCSNTSTSTNTKSPDVLNSSAKLNGKPNGVPAKPLNITPKAAPKTLKPLKSPTDKKPLLNKSSSDVKPPISAKIINKANSDVSNVSSKTLPAAPRLAAKQTSHVATLQQKFENNKSPPVAVALKTIGKKK